MKKNRFFTILGIVLAILLIPLVAMQFTSEVSWQLGDFVIFGGLLLGVGVLIDMAMRKLNKSKYKTLIIFGIIVLFLLIWAELGVGIFGTPFAGS